MFHCKYLLKCSDVFVNVLLIDQVFHCSADGLMSVNNDVECWMGVHWAYLIPVILTALFIYVVFPIWLIWCVRREALAATSHHHEDFLKLKEVCIYDIAKTGLLQFIIRKISEFCFFLNIINLPEHIQYFQHLKVLFWHDTRYMLVFCHQLLFTIEADSYT